MEKKTDTHPLFTQEQFQRDVDYYRAQLLSQALLEEGLLTVEQFDQLTRLNRQSFRPFLAEILPDPLDFTAK